MTIPTGLDALLVLSKADGAVGAPKPNLAPVHAFMAVFATNASTAITAADTTTSLTQSIGLLLATSKHGSMRDIR